MTDEERKARRLASHKRYRLKHKAKCQAYAAAYRLAHKKPRQPLPTVKTCGHCLTEKPFTAFTRRSHNTGERSPRGAFGLERFCNACRSHLRKPTLVAERRARAALTAAGLKTCSVCRTAKPLSAFHVRRASPDGVSFTCTICANTRSAAWLKAHPTANVDWYQKNKTYKRQHFAKWRQANLEHHRAGYRRWANANADRVRALSAHRNATKMKATPSWANQSAISAIYREAIRLTRNTGVTHEVDHIIPLRSPLVCGLHCEANLQILTSTENRRKGNKFTPHTTLPQWPCAEARR
jgi:hypothetical protein